MVKIRRERANHVTVIDQALVRDDRLSWKARGIFAYLWSQAEAWEFNEIEVSRHATDGRASLRSGLKELEKYGYLERNRERDDKGRVNTSIWYLHEKPMFKNPTLEKSMLENGTQRYHQEKITSKEDNIKESISEKLPATSHKSKKKFADDSTEMRLAMYLFAKIKENNHEHKALEEATKQKWADHVRLMIQRDHRTPEGIKAMIDWCQSDKFWKLNILSTAKLRKQYDNMKPKFDEAQKRQHQLSCGMSFEDRYRQSQNQRGLH